MNEADTSVAIRTGPIPLLLVNADDRADAPCQDPSFSRRCVQRVCHFQSEAAAVLHSLSNFPLHTMRGLDEIVGNGYGRGVCNVPEQAPHRPPTHRRHLCPFHKPLEHRSHRPRYHEPIEHEHAIIRPKGHAVDLWQLSPLSNEPLRVRQQLRPHQSCTARTWGGRTRPDPIILNCTRPPPPLQAHGRVSLNG